MDAQGQAGSAPETRPVASPGTLASRVSLNLADAQVLKFSQQVSAPASPAPARTGSLKPERNLAVVGKLPSMKKGTLTKTTSKIVFPGVLPDGGAQSHSPSLQYGTAGRLEGKSRTAKASGQADSASKPVVSSGNIALRQNKDMKAPVSRYKVLDPIKQPLRDKISALKHLELKRRGGKGLIAAEAETSPTGSGPRRFVYERMRSHLQDAAANAAEAWAAGMAEGLARFRTRTGATKPEEDNDNEGKQESKKGGRRANTAAARSAAYEKRRMQRQVAHKLGLDTSTGTTGEPESSEDIMKKLWTVENLLTVETEWFRKKEKKQKEQSFSRVNAKALASFRKNRMEPSVPKKNFNLSDVYTAVQNNHEFDFSEEIPVDAPPPNRLAYLSQTVMTGVDGFAKQCHGYPLDLEAIPEEAADILEAAASEMEAQLQALNQQSTHIALDAMVLCVLDMQMVDATIEAISEQVPYPTNAVIPGLLKMNMVRFVYWHTTSQWRLVLRENWLHAATQPDTVASDTQLSRSDVLGILATAYDLSGLAQRDIEMHDIVFAQDMKGLKVKAMKEKLEEFNAMPCNPDTNIPKGQSSVAETAAAAAEALRSKEDPAAGTVEHEASLQDQILNSNGDSYTSLAEGSIASSLELDETTVTFKKAHPLAGTVFYDRFKDTGHSIERRRDGQDNVIELLRDIKGTLLAIGFPVWDPVAGEYVRQVSQIDDAVSVNVPLKRKPVIRKRKDPEDQPVPEEAPDEALEEGSDAQERFTQVQYVADGHGGFLEIVDDATQGGLFAVHALRAQDLKSCLEGQGVNYGSVRLLFVDGVHPEEVAKIRDEAAKEVSQQPQAVGLLQNLLDEALRFDGPGADSISYEPDSEGDQDTPREQRLMMVHPPPKSSCVEDPAGAQGAAPPGKHESGQQAETDTDGMPDAADLDETGASQQRNSRNGTTLRSNKNGEQDLEDIQDGPGSFQSHDDFETDSAERRRKSASAGKDADSSKRGQRRHSEPARQNNRSKNAKQSRRARKKRSKSLGARRIGENGEELSDWSEGHSGDEDDGSMYGNSWEGSADEGSDDSNSENGRTAERTGAAGPANRDEGKKAAGGPRMTHTLAAEQSMDSDQARKMFRKKKKKQKSNTGDGGSSDSSYIPHDYDSEELQSLDPEALARGKRWLALKKAEARERAKDGNIDENSRSEDEGGSRRRRRPHRGSNATSVNLRGVRDRSKQHPDETGSKGSSEAGSLQFDQFLDAQGSDEDDPWEKARSVRGKLRVSYARTSTIDLQNRPKFNPYATRPRQESGATGFASEPYQDPVYGTSRGPDTTAGRRSITRAAGYDLRGSMGGHSTAYESTSQGGGRGQSPWKAAGTIPEINDGRFVSCQFLR